jgi:hypothetical protein
VVLLHGFEQRRLRLRRGAVDLVSEENLGKDRTLHETKRPVASLLVEHLRAGNIGRHQIGRELNPLEGQIQNLRQGLDQERLGETGHPGDEAMPSGEECHQDLIDDLVLPDDHLSNLRKDAFASLRDPFGNRRDIRRRLMHQCVSE